MEFSLLVIFFQEITLQTNNDSVDSNLDKAEYVKVQPSRNASSWAYLSNPSCVLQTTHNVWF